MQETHHRIKNNLQVIVALVEMQAEELGDNAAMQAHQAARPFARHDS